MNELLLTRMVRTLRSAETSLLDQILNKPLLKTAIENESFLTCHGFPWSRLKLAEYWVRNAYAI